MDTVEAELRTAFNTVGREGIVRLIAAFYRQVPESPLLSPMYPPAELAAAEQRLRNFLLFRLGGDPTYVEQRGHPRLRMRHAPFAVTPAASEEWIRMMDQAFAECLFPSEAEQPLKRFLQATAHFLVNQFPSG